MRLVLLISLFISMVKAEIVLVTNKYSTINSLSNESVKYLYLGKIDTIDGVRIKPLVSKDKDLHNKFVNYIINKNISQYNSYWARLVFTGRKPIPKRLNTVEINEELSKMNTIIYINKNNLSDKWKIIYEHR